MKSVMKIKGRKTQKKLRIMYQDGKRKLNQSKCSFLEEEFSIPHDNVDRLKPLQYFQMFWKHDINVQPIEQMNLYNVQKRYINKHNRSRD